MPTECNLAETVSENKKNLNAEFKEKYGGLKENCFPRPGRGCRCIEKDTDGNEVERRYELESDCKVSYCCAFYFALSIYIIVRYPWECDELMILYVSKQLGTMLL